MKFIDLFSGIGGFRLGMESVGHECIGFCEIDKFARESYKSIFQTEGEIEFHDIRDVSDDEFKKLRGKVGDKLLVTTLLPNITKIYEAVEASVKFAEESPFPPLESAFEDIYAD